MEAPIIAKSKINTTVLLFAGIAILAIVATVGALVLRQFSGEDRSRASLANLCAYAFEVGPQQCNETCNETADCSTGHTCYRASGSTTGVGVCRQADNPTSTTCSPSGSSTPIASTTPRGSATPTPVGTPTAVACNQPCDQIEGGTRVCGNGMACVTVEGQSLCKNPTCPTSSTCGCGVTTPVPTPVAVCQQCNYQVDLVYGDVITSFTEAAGATKNVQYGVRLIEAKTDRGNFNNTGRSQYGACVGAVPPAAVAQPAYPTFPTGCDPQGKIVTTFDSKMEMIGGYAKATVKNLTTACTYSLNLVSYKANWGTDSSFTQAEFDSQVVFDRTPVTLNPGATAEVFVRLPVTNTATTACYNPAAKPGVRLL